MNYELRIILYLCSQMEKILITGASGFIGSHIVEKALQEGFQVWAAVRKSSSRDFLTDQRIQFLELNLQSEAQMVSQFRDLQFDYVVHAAGATKCLDEHDFERINTDGTRNLVNALLAVKMPLKRFVFISSLSIMGAIREQQPYSEINDSDQPRPNTAYGRSKLKAEQFLDSLGGNFPYIILRPTGVYGPRERDYFVQVQSIQRHVDFAVGFSRQDITFIYVTDVVQAVFLALERGTVGHRYILSDGEVYQSSTFSNLVHEALGRPWWIRLTAPLFLLRVICACGTLWSRLTRKVIVLNNDKYNILSQRNWRCNIDPARNELGFQPQVKLPEGVRRSVQWYKEHHWL